MADYVNGSPAVNLRRIVTAQRAPAWYLLYQIREVETRVASAEDEELFLDLVSEVSNEIERDALLANGWNLFGYRLRKAIADIERRICERMVS